MNIGIIGAGQVGQALARGWTRAGHTVRLGVRQAADERVAELARTTGLGVATNAEVVHTCEVIVLSVHWAAVPEVLDEIGPLLAGKVVLDATNPLTFEAGRLGLALGFTDSGAETIQRAVPQARVVKTMNQVGFKVMDQAHGYPTAPAMFVASDDASARAVACALVSDLGFAAMDCGELRQARLLEPYAMLWIHQVIGQGASDTSAFGWMNKTFNPTSNPEPAT